MQIVFHIGAHCTDEGALVRSLLKNRVALADEGIIVPAPSRYRDTLRDAVNTLHGQPASQDTQDYILDAVLDMDDAERIIFSNESFISVPDMALRDGYLYPKSYKCLWLRNVFPDHPVEFHLGIRNPATFLPALHAKIQHGASDFRQFMGATDPMDLRWSDFIARLRHDTPDCPVTVWCNEDTPFTWLEVMREVSAHDPYTKLKGGFDILRQIMAREGVQRLRAYMGKRPPQTEDQRRKYLSAFLDKYAIIDAVEQELDLPGWTEDLVEAMTQNYEDDVLEISRMPGVTFVSP